MERVPNMQGQEGRVNDDDAVVAPERAKHNPLFKEDFGDVPEGYVSVWRDVNPKALEYIAQHGIRIAPAREATNERTRRLDEAFDRYAPAGFSRHGSILAHPRRESKRYDPTTSVRLEMKIDATRALVANGEWIAEAVHDPAHIDDYAQLYWETAMPLTTFQTLSEEERARFTYPEVVIPDDVVPDHIRVDSAGSSAHE